MYAIRVVLMLQPLPHRNCLHSVRKYEPAVREA